MADGSGSPYQLRITFDRFLKVVPQDHILVVTPARFAGEARKVLPELLPENLLQEPMARKTAPCMAYAAYTLLSRNREAVIVATPWDLVIRDESLFAHTLGEAFHYVEENDVLMTLGIVPKTPDVNFGYIQVREGRRAGMELVGGPIAVIPVPGTGAQTIPAANLRIPLPVSGQSPPWSPISYSIFSGLSGTRFSLASLS